MRKIITLTLIASVLSMVSFAKTLRVGYPGKPVSGVDFSDFQSANNAASDGDSLYIFPGNWNVNLSKQVIVIGKGFNTEGAGSNANLQNLSGNVTVSIDLYPGSDSSIFYGLSDGYIRSYYNTPIDNIKIRRCQLSYIFFNNKTCNNWEVSQCIIYSNISFTWGGGLATNLLVANSYLNNVSLNGGAGAGLSGAFINNVFGNGANYLHNGAFVFQSNIFIGTSASLQNSANSIFQNNLAEATSVLPAGNGNVNSVNMANTFVGYPTQGTFSNDGRYVLKTGGPAIAAGYNGVDAGMFGGPNPYRISGIPPIPTIYKLTAPSTTASSNPYTITLSVKSNN